MRHVALCVVVLTCSWLGDTAVVPESYDTIVVGLGAAGAEAAATLAGQGRRVLALEAQDRIGGRVKTVPVEDGVVEVGAEWIHGTSDSITYNLAVENNITLVTQEFNSRVIKSDGKPLPEDIQNVVMELIEHCEETWSSLSGEPQPLGDFLTKTARDFIREKKSELLDDKNLMDGILDLLEEYFCSLEGCNTWFEPSTFSKYKLMGGHPYTSWHRNGYKTLFEILLKTYNNGPGLPNLEIKLKTEVTRISWSEDPEQPVSVTCKDGAVYTVRDVIVTVSLGVLKARHTTLFSPPLPQDKVTAIEKMSMGCIGKLIVIFSHQVFDTENTYMFIWTAEDRAKLPDEDKWISHLMGPSFSMGNNQTITMWSNGEVTKEIESLPEDVAREKVMGLLRRLMGNITTIPEPTGIIKTNWCTFPYTLGTYSFDNVQTPQYPDARRTLGEPLLDRAGRPRVLFAGEATHPIYFSTVHGALATGRREALRLQ